MRPSKRRRSQQLQAFYRAVLNVACIFAGLSARQADGDEAVLMPVAMACRRMAWGQHARRGTECWLTIVQYLSFSVFQVDCMG